MNDPYKDFDEYDSKQQAWLDKLPRCSCCDEPIQQEKAVYYNDQWCCEECEITFWKDIREDFLVDIDEK